MKICVKREILSCCYLRASHVKTHMENVYNDKMHIIHKRSLDGASLDVFYHKRRQAHICSIDSGCKVGGVFAFSSQDAYNERVLQASESRLNRL